MRRIVILFAGVALLAASTPPVMAQSSSDLTNNNLVHRGVEQPSFDCAKAKTGSAKLICADAELAKLDGELGVAFQKKKNQLPLSDQTTLATEEVAWIRERNSLCGLIGKGSASLDVLVRSKACMVREIRSRIAALNGSEVASNKSRPATQEDIDDCNSNDPDRLLRGCTRLLLDKERSKRDRAIAFNDRGNAYFNMQDYHGAIDDYTEAIRADPNYAQAFNNRAVAYQRLGDQARSQVDFGAAQKVAEAEQINKELEEGYKRISFEDFLLDGKVLAASEARVSIKGVYVKLGAMEELFPSTIASMMAQRTLRTDDGIGILTDDASRNVRKYLLDCRNNVALAQVGCPLTVMGHATMCTRTTLVGTTNMPCLVVEDGR